MKYYRTSVIVLGLKIVVDNATKNWLGCCIVSERATGPGSGKCETRERTNAYIKRGHHGHQRLSYGITNSFIKDLILKSEQISKLCFRFKGECMTLAPRLVYSWS